jgi:hypothetical protein
MALSRGYNSVEDPARMQTFEAAARRWVQGAVFVPTSQTSKWI